MSRAALAFAGLSLLLAQVAFAAPYTGPCGFTTGSGGSTATVSKPIVVDGFPGATETLSVVNGNFVVTIAFGGGFVPTPGKTYIQFYFFEEQANVTALFDGTGTHGDGNSCDYLSDGLNYYTKWGNSAAISTLPTGSTVVYDGLSSVTITTPIYTSSLPFWYIKPSDICKHIKPTPSSLIVRIFDVSTLNRNAPDGQCGDPLAEADGILPFTFTCSCPAVPPPPSPNGNPSSFLPPPTPTQQPVNALPPPNLRPRSPPPSLSPPIPGPTPPCAVNGSSGVIVNNVYKSVTVDGEEDAALISLGLNTAANVLSRRRLLAPGDSFVISIDFGFGSFVPTTHTIIQYGFFEEYDNYTTWENNKGLNCSPTKDGLYFFLRWGASSNPTLPNGTVATYDGLKVTIIQPLQSEKTPWWGLDVPLDSFCLHNKPGGARLATRIYDETTVADTNSTATEPCVEDTKAVDSLLPFSFVCNCTSQEGGGDISPPPKAKRPLPPSPAPPSPSPPPVCTSTSAPSGPCQFDVPSAHRRSLLGFSTLVVRTFPLIKYPGATVDVSITLPGVYTVNPVFHISIRFNNFVPINGTTYIHYRFYEGYNTPKGVAPDTFQGGFNVQLADKGSNCAAGDDSTLYSIKYGSSTTVYGFKSSSPAIHYSTNAIDFDSPIRDPSMIAWNLNANDIKSLCCHQKDGGTVFGIRIFNAPASSGKAPCPEDLLALALGNFNFLLDCSCPAPGRRLMSLA